MFCDFQICTGSQFTSMRNLGEENPCVGFPKSLLRTAARSHVLAARSNIFVTSGRFWVGDVFLASAVSQPCQIFLR